MTHDETHLDCRFVRTRVPRLRNALCIAAVTCSALVGGYGCGQAPGGLFSTSGNSQGIAGSSSTAGNQSAGGAVGSANGGSAVDTGGASVAAAGMPSGMAGNAPGAGAPNSGGGGMNMDGGSGGGMGGSGGAAPSACDGKLVVPPALIADFEQGVAGWFGYIGDAPAPVVSTQPGADMTQYAAQFSGGAAKISGMYFPMPCRDVSGFDGISFWGRSDATSAVRFLAVIPATDPTAGIGDCDAATMTCSDHPGKPFTFGPEWTLYHAAWSELKQLGFGAQASFAGVINAVLWINDGAVDHFNFSIDEVTLYKGGPPTP